MFFTVFLLGTPHSNTIDVRKPDYLEIGIEAFSVPEIQKDKNWMLDWTVLYTIITHYMFFGMGFRVFRSFFDCCKLLLPSIHPF